MPQPFEHDSPKAFRILSAARELLLEHGIRKVTIAEIARAAGVGKGTVYLYWATKEDLIVALFGREVLTALDEIDRALSADPELVRPGRLCALILRNMLNRALARRLHSGDEDALRLMAHHSASGSVLARAAPSALCTDVLGILREHGLVRVDRPLNEQSYALHALLVGFMATETVAWFAGPAIESSSDQVLADAVGLLVGHTADPGHEAVRAATTQVRTVLGELREEITTHLG
ncbi:TetR/AcrR family transcriptional regulator [Marinitenerispora sediminis]|uniref:TetR/AcrR family transcriptional regulator n=1 Tax=Marinitenerispora sediminis TaxID=1931232 RepID=A0A368T9D2_9ACTN|nr:TetR/AcrR family transcriptional regulator [Marinitenerispora sediminis]RCV52066.1 TetR/AcrR family transcriptional regulator [Marinitenerispora sediminis]RCV58085.1 TetR/AcrR family transcriptional regulator [Marinitenerispora sediminis]RCV60853.1 TetR/AcrR family transcriptional regulator [Marinitenerispora sediminis]